MSKKVFIKTFGCQMNEYDSGKMVDVLHAAQGYELTQDVDEADLVLFNTCSVREKAQEKVFSDLGRIKHLKKKGVQIGVGGCVASQEGAAIIARAPMWTWCLARNPCTACPTCCTSGPCKTGRRSIQLPGNREVRPPAAGPRRRGLGLCQHHGRLLQILQLLRGAYTRGEEVSRPFDDVLVEVAGLADQGVKEVTLLGQNVNAYRGAMGDTGRDRRFRPAAGVCQRHSGIERLRYTTSHPNEFTPRLIQAYAQLPKLVSHLHLPVQHGSDRILMAMKRGYTAMEYKSTVRKLRAIRPDMAHEQRLHRRLPRRNRGRLPEDDAAGARRGL